MAINVTLALVDSYGRRTTKRVETNETTLAGAETAVGLYATDLDAITDLALIGVIYSSRDPSEVFDGEAGSNVDVGATFQVLTDSGKAASHKVPGFDVALVGGLGTIDVTAVPIVAYFANFETEGAMRLSDGEAVVEVISGVLDR